MLNSTQHGVRDRIMGDPKQRYDPVESIERIDEDVSFPLDLKVVQRKVGKVRPMSQKKLEDEYKIMKTRWAALDDTTEHQRLYTALLNTIGKGLYE